MLCDLPGQLPAAPQAWELLLLLRSSTTRLS
jgi:hypothetical protein